MKKILSTKTGKIILAVVVIFLLIGIFGDTSASELKELKQLHEELISDMDSLQADYDTLLIEKSDIEQTLAQIPEDLLEQLGTASVEGRLIELYEEGEPDRAALLKENETLTQKVSQLEEDTKQLKKDKEKLEEEKEKLLEEQEQPKLEESQSTQAAALTSDQNPQTQSQPETAPETEAPSTPVETIVHITKTGSKYHRSGCSYLKSDIEISLSDAQARGYTSCSRCY